MVAGPDTFGVAKPDPGHLSSCLGPLDRGLPAVVVGDSEVDCAAALAARLPVIAVSWGYAKTPVAEIGADAVVSHFHEVPGTVRRLAGLNDSEDHTATDQN